MRFLRLMTAVALGSTLLAVNAEALQDLPPVCVGTTACVDTYCIYCDVDVGVKATGGGSTADAYIDAFGFVTSDSQGSHVKVFTPQAYACARVPPAFTDVATVYAGLGSGPC